MAKKADIEKLSALEQFENQAKGEQGQLTEKIIKPFDNKEEVEEVGTGDKTNMLDGYFPIDRDRIPQQALLYPPTWEFAYRIPLAKEVANFSTINERDNPAIINAVQDLVRKCIIIFDTDKNVQVNSSNICDAHQTFFVVLLRNAYIGSPISNKTMCSLCKEQYDSLLTEDKLAFQELNQKLIEAYDPFARLFSLVYPGVEEPISFLVPTIGRSSNLFKYVVKAYKDQESQERKDIEKVIYDKQFLLVAPYLYEKGTEQIRELALKYTKLKQDENRFKAYLEIVAKLKLDNLEYLNETCPHCDSMEESQIRFPGGWKNMFVATKSSAGYFD